MKKRLGYVTKRMLPLFIIVGITIIMLGYVHQSILKLEQESCWQTLEDTAATINDLVEARLNDNINTLKLVSNAMVQENRVESRDAIIQHINAFQEMTIFNRIDMLYADGTLLLQSGKTMQIEENFDFGEIKENGVYISSRQTDVANGKQVIRCCVPVLKNNSVVAVLVGIIECDSLPEYFGTRAYGGNAVTCIVNSEDGQFIMDDWHDELGNMYEMRTRQMLSGYEDVDLVAEVKANKTGAVGYISEKNHQISYMYYTPIGVESWQLLIVAQENVAFAGVIALKNYLVLFAVVELLLIIIYLFWGAHGTYQLMQGKEALEKLSVTDGLTDVFNRNRFNAVVEAYMEQDNEQIGIAYFDINGLKETNDTLGHGAGDKLIVSIAKVIESIFPEQIYRIGGDEFAVITPAVSEEAFYEQLQCVDVLLEMKNLSVAYGSCFCKDSREINKGLHEADRQMYECKQKYYAAHGKTGRY